MKLIDLNQIKLNNPTTQIIIRNSNKNLEYLVSIDTREKSLECVMDQFFNNLTDFNSKAFKKRKITQKDDFILTMIDNIYIFDYTLKSNLLNTIANILSDLVLNDIELTIGFNILDIKILN